MTVQQPEWASQFMSGQRQQLSQQPQHQPGTDEHDDRDQPQVHQVDFARPESPSITQLPDFPLPKSYTGSSGSPRDNVQNLNQSPTSPTMHRRRSSSISSGVSVLTNPLSSGLASVHPAPAYVGPFGATQVVAEHQAGLKAPSGDDEDGERPPSGKEGVAFSPPALALLNGFLDQLLFSFLAYAKSTRLTELRPAVTDVLSPRLASEAIASAEEELQELLGDAREEDEDQKQASEEDPWDLELVWRRTRLRVMVYIRLGDMEDDDEERYVREGEHNHNGVQRFSQSTGLVSWAAAIFLTSVVEYVAERVLRVAGQVAIDRARLKARNAASPTSSTSRANALKVEDYDMEKVALNSGLSRLWRKWRKAQRSSTNSPTTPTYRNGRRQGSIDQTVGSLMSPRRSSFGTARESPESRRESLDTARESPDEDVHDVPEAEYPEHVIASNIPLPLGDHKRDVDEIEVPGLAMDPDEPPTIDESSDPRRKSFGGQAFSWLPITLFGPTTADKSPDASERPTLSRQRSSSVPALFRISSLPQEDRNPVSVENQEELAAVGEETAGTEPEQPAAAHDEDALGEEPHKAMNGLSDSVSPQPTEETEATQPRGLVEGAVAGITAATAAAAAAVGLSESRQRIEKPTVNLAEEQAHQTLAEPERANLSPDTFTSEETPIGATAKRHEPATGDQTATSVIHAEAPLQLENAVHETQTVANHEEPPHPDTRADIDASGGNFEAPQNAVVTDHAEPSAHLDGRLPSPTPDMVEVAAMQKSQNSPATLSSKSAPPRPAKLIIGTSAADFPPSPTSHVSSLSQQDGRISPTVGGFAEPRPISISPHSSQFERRRTPSPNEQTRFPAPLPINRNSMLNAMQRPPNTEQSALRSANSPADRNSQWLSMKIPMNPEPTPTVHEHPVIQRIASLKGADVRHKDEEKVQPLTSASIKGPEDFEMFVQGGDTVKYTLTPENVRDEPFAKRSLDGLPSSPINATSPVEPRPGRTSTIKQALAAIPDSIMESSFTTRPAIRENRQSVSRPSVRNTSISRRNGLMAREPRVMTESTRDFADFIRSTGPDREQQPISLLASKSSPALRAQKTSPAGPTRSGSYGGVVSKHPNASSVRAVRNPSTTSPNAKSKSTMQPRAATSVSAGSAELIDFIRNGPNQVREHRISRTVAPFRTTMDSEQLNEWSDQILSHPESILSNSEAHATHKQSVSSIWSSNQASANSRSALITTIEAPLTNKASNSRINEGEPARKAFRNKDPYALPSDDEDDILMNPPPKRNEESMMDFLRDTDSPVANTAARVPDSRDNTTRANNARTTLRNGDVSAVTTERSKALPGLQIATATHTQNFHAGSTPSGARNKLEARSPGTPIRDANHSKAIHGRTNELADFLRNSSPPEARTRPDPLSAPAPTVARLSKPQPPSKHAPSKDNSGRRSFFGSLFGRGAKKV